MRIRVEMKLCIRATLRVKETVAIPYRNLKLIGRATQIKRNSGFIEASSQTAGRFAHPLSRLSSLLLDLLCQLLMPRSHRISS